MQRIDKMKKHKDKSIQRRNSGNVIPMSQEGKKKPDKERNMITEHAFMCSETCAMLGTRMNILMSNEAQQKLDESKR